MSKFAWKEAMAALLGVALCAVLAPGQHRSGGGGGRVPHSGGGSGVRPAQAGGGFRAGQTPGSANTGRRGAGGRPVHLNTVRPGSVAAGKSAGRPGALNAARVSTRGATGRPGRLNSARANGTARPASLGTGGRAGTNNAAGVGRRVKLNNAARGGQRTAANRVNSRLRNVERRQHQTLFNALTGRFPGARLGRFGVLAGLAGDGGDEGILPATLEGDSLAAMIPMDADNPNGSAFVLAMDSNLDEVATAADEDPSLDVDAAIADASSWQTTRHLRVANATKEPLTVYLQYRTFDENGDWDWVPARPGADDVLSYDLEPGQAADLQESDWRIHASRVLIWAVSDTQDYSRFQNQDLWLVPETGDDGQEHGYSAPDIQTMTVAIR